MVNYAFLSPNKLGDFVNPIELEIKDTTRSVSFLDIRFKLTVRAGTLLWCLLLFCIRTA
jgi:hypothetical protein